MAIGDVTTLCLVCSAPLDAEGRCTGVNEFFHTDLGNEDAPELPAAVQEDPVSELENTCYLCGGPLVSGECIAYHWHDGLHLRNRARMDPDSPWGGIFHSKAEAENAPPITFLIDGFLQREGVTAIAAPVRERKSLIALNIVHALVTGERLFDYFEVVKKPESVIYLCPEVSLGPFTDRVRKIGLMGYVGEKFFYRTLSAEGTLKLNDENLRGCLPGSVVVLDTAIRFLDGDENSSKDVRAFADGIFDLLKGGAEAVILLHHSPKDTGDSMTLESAMRGSGDMGAFLACCWGTKLQDPANPYESPSFLSNLKQRDFESRDFEVTCGPDCRMHIVGDPATRFVNLTSRRGKPANKDGMDSAAEIIIRANMDTPIRKLQELLAEQNISRGTNWIARRRARLKTDSPDA